MNRITVCIAFLAGWLFIPGGCHSPVPATTTSREVTYILVRHAEKSGSEKTSDLTDAGHERAGRLALMLKDLPLNAVYSTDVVRTRHTVQPCAEQHGLTIQTYRGADVPDFARLLRDAHQDSVVLISGHSDTTPKLANALLGEERFVFIPEADYTQILLIQCQEQGPCRHLLLHY